MDIDPATKPDVVASMTNMGDIGSFDTVYCSHALEHLYPHEVPIALAEFWRVLKPGGTLVVMVPDLEGVEPTERALPGMGLSGLHLFYGDAARIKDAPYMAHHCGFVAETLGDALTATGFVEVETQRETLYNLLGIGRKE